MRGMFVLSIIIAISVMRSESLNQGDTGVCSETKTINAMTTNTFMETYNRGFTSCTFILLLPICSTKYRIANRYRSRIVYRIVETDVLTCCPGYVEVEDQCKSEATTKVITTRSPTSASSTSPTSLPSSLASSLFTTSMEQSVFSNPPAKNKLSSFTKTLIISGVAFFAVVVIIGVLALCIFAVMRKKKMRRPEITPSPPQRKEKKNDPEPDAQYYTDIPENETGYSAVVLGASYQHSTLSTISKQPKEDKTKVLKKSECTYKDRERQQTPGMDTPKQYEEVKLQSNRDKRYNRAIHTERPSTEIYYGN